MTADGRPGEHGTHAPEKWLVSPVSDKREKLRRLWWWTYFSESAGATAVIFAVLAGAAVKFVLEFRPDARDIPWLVYMLILFAAQLWVYRGLYLRYSRLVDAARHDALLPPAQRERVLKIKEAASQISARVWRTGGLDGALDQWIAVLDSEAGALKEHEAVMTSVRAYLACINMLRMRKTIAPTDEELLESARKVERQAFDVLIELCNALLEEHPAPRP